jgi:hypothetical protein
MTAATNPDLNQPGGLVIGSSCEMDQPGLPNELPPELREWFSVEIDLGDAPELHLVGLEAAEFVRCFDTLRRYAGIWSSRTFHIDAENADVTIGERPDVAELVRCPVVSVDNQECPA